MRNFVRNILAAFAIAIAPTAFADELNDEAQLKNFQTQAVNTVVQLDRDCSGVVIDTDNIENTYIITAQHCVDGVKSGFVNIDIKDKQKIIETRNLTYDVIQRDTSHDLAFLKVRQTNLNLDGAVLAQSDPQEGVKAVAVGYPLGWTRTITEGYMGGYESIDIGLKGFDPYGNERALRRATAPITGGNSGGGLFIKEEGTWKLAGISDAGVGSFPQAALYVPVDPILEIVRGALLTEAKTTSPQLIPASIDGKKKND